MFGHSNNDTSGASATDASAGALDQPVETVVPTPSAPTVNDNDMPGDYVMTDLPHVATTELATTSSDPVTTTEPASAPAATPVVVRAPASSAVSGDTDDLLEIKQAALQELSPLIGHLEQTPEEKFRTTMMMIQASDNQDLLREAFLAAKEIADEKLRAQALLDVVNEINYFTQQAESE
jgi:hypothetical protein